MRICKVENCNRRHFGLGFCQLHYRRWKKYQDPHEVHTRIYTKINIGKCIVEGCNEKQRLRHLCRKHHYRFITYGDPLISGKHRGRNIKGELNPRWHGGIGEYPNHTLMKKNRLLKLQESKGKCEVCQKVAIVIHHVDGSKSNHSIDNLVALCHSCHGVLHIGRRNSTSKLKRLYGLSLPEMTDQFGYSKSFFYYLHRKNTLKNFLDNLKNQ